MILTCPACFARYVVDPAALGSGGRTVRCSRCQETWFEAPEDTPDDRFAPMPEPVMAVAEETEETPLRDMGFGAAVPSFLSYTDRPAPASKTLPAVRRSKGASSKALAWVAIVLLVVVLGTLLVIGRQRVVGYWPGAATLYAALGLPTGPVGAGLELRGVNSAVTQVNGKPTLVVAGEIANVAQTAEPVPDLTIVLRDSANKVIKSWTISPSRSALTAGETLPFQSSLTAPPPSAASALVTFGTP